MSTLIRRIARRLRLYGHSPQREFEGHFCLTASPLSFPTFPFGPTAHGRLKAFQLFSLSNFCQFRPSSKETSAPFVPTAIHALPCSSHATAERNPEGSSFAAVQVCPPSLVRAAVPSLSAGFR